MSNKLNNFYFFIYDDNSRYYYAEKDAGGSWVVSDSASPYPLSFSPANFKSSRIEFATNNKYFGLVRFVAEPFNFIEDGAAILRYLYLIKKGIEQKAYILVIKWDGAAGIHKTAFRAKLDFGKKKDDHKTNTFIIPAIDDSAWGVLSQRDSVDFQIDCSPTNNKAINVLFDGITLVNKATFQPSSVNIGNNSDDNAHAVNILPLTLVNQDGDSAGIVLQTQSYQNLVNLHDSLPTSLNHFFYTASAININISGSVSFKVLDTSANIHSIHYIIYSSLDQNISIFPIIVNPVLNNTYIFNFNIDIDVAEGESLFACYIGACIIKPIVTNIVVKTNTKAQASTAYSLRPLDLLRSIVNKATYGRYSINSNYFTLNNKEVVTSGDAIRNIPNSYIKSSFQDFFKTYDALHYLALRIIDGQLWIEPATEVYKTNTNILDLGEVTDLESEPALEYYFNEVKVGSPKQDYRHASGRLEFNTTNSFSLPFLTVDKKLDIVSKYRLDGFGIEFLRLDYQNESTQDNIGDAEPFVVAITDEQAPASTPVETFVDFTVDNAPLQPYIRYPFQNSYITYNKPTISGVAPSGQTVNIYADGVLDGSVVSDLNNNWSYNIQTALASYNPGVFDGAHIIDVTFGDETDPKSTLNIIVDTTITTDTAILYPNPGASLYNNKPLFLGVSQRGDNFNVVIDGVIRGNVTADGSCLWKFQSPVLTNGNHSITVNGYTQSFFVNSNVEFPLITSFKDGFIEINNKPLIEGVSKPFTLVELWLNYISYKSIGSVTSDANGNWSFQTVDTTYDDPLSGLPVVIVPIQNGLNIISTSLINHSVDVNILGYKLNRPDYSSIIGVTDNTVFNTTLSPKRMLNARNPLFAAMLLQQKNSLITFESGDKNSNLVTVLDGVTVSERANVNSSTLGLPIGLLEKVKFKTRVPSTFNDIFYNFSNGGIISIKSRGTTLYCLPIGKMSMAYVTDEVQEWELLLAPSNTFQTLLSLYKNGLTINIMKNSIYHSDFNSIHFVTYDFQPIPKYNFKEIYDDWFENRNSAWALNPQYIQKFQQTETIIDQIITNGINAPVLRMYRCSDAFLVHTFAYNPVNPAPIPIPMIVMEAVIDLSAYDEDQYFFVLMVGDLAVSISERIQTKAKWAKTVLIEAYNSQNQPGAFFSTGFKTILRLEGFVKKWQPNPTIISNTDEEGNSQLLYGLPARKRTIYYGNAYGLPDYLSIKMSLAMQLDNFYTEGFRYVLSQEDNIDPSEDIPAHPLYYYKVPVLPYENETGKVFPAAEDAVISGVVLVVDGTAFGLPVGTVKSIELN